MPSQRWLGSGLLPWLAEPASDVRRLRIVELLEDREGLLPGLARGGLASRRQLGLAQRGQGLGFSLPVTEFPAELKGAPQAREGGNVSSE